MSAPFFAGTFIYALKLSRQLHLIFSLGGVGEEVSEATLL